MPSKNPDFDPLRAALDDEEDWAQRAAASRGRAAQAYVRLLELAETRDSGQISRIARFLAGTFNGDAFPFDLFELRSVDVAISDDMLLCLDALRWGKADLHRLVPDGERRVLSVLESPGASGHAASRGPQRPEDSKPERESRLGGGQEDHAHDRRWGEHRYRGREHHLRVPGDLDGACGEEELRGASSRELPVAGNAQLGNATNQICALNEGHSR